MYSVYMERATSLSIRPTEQPGRIPEICGGLLW